MEMTRRSGTREIVNAVDLDKIEWILIEALNNPATVEMQRSGIEWSLAQIRRAQKKLRGAQ